MGAIPSSGYDHTDNVLCVCPAIALYTSWLGAHCCRTDAVIKKSSAEGTITRHTCLTLQHYSAGDCSNGFKLCKMSIKVRDGMTFELYCNKHFDLLCDSPRAISISSAHAYQLGADTIGVGSGFKHASTEKAANKWINKQIIQCCSKRVHHCLTLS